MKRIRLKEVVPIEDIDSNPNFPQMFYHLDYVKSASVKNASYRGDQSFIKEIMKGRATNEE